MKANIPDLAELVRALAEIASHDGRRHRPAAHGVGPSADDGRRRAAGLRTAPGGWSRVIGLVMQVGSASGWPPEAVNT